MRLFDFLYVVGVGVPALACEDCYGPQNDVVMTRKVKRMQPDAKEAPYPPQRPLEWGQINFLHTTDTHGWLEGHIKEENYGADWGDFVSFVAAMKQKAEDLKVDLLLIDTGVRQPPTGESITEACRTSMMALVFPMQRIPTVSFRIPSSKTSITICSPSGTTSST